MCPSSILATSNKIIITKSGVATSSAAALCCRCCTLLPLQPPPSSLSLRTSTSIYSNHRRFPRQSLMQASPRTRMTSIRVAATAQRCQPPPALPKRCKERKSWWHLFCFCFLCVSLGCITQFSPFTCDETRMLYESFN
jgi:hypothetical protein